jgi:putative transposase
LRTAQEYARRLYNFTRYCAVAYNYRLRKQRGDWFRLGKMPKYPGYAGMWQAMHDDEYYKVLNDRVASYILRLFDQMMRSWFSNLKHNPRARPPRYAEKPPPLTFVIGRNGKYLGDGTWRFSALSGNLIDRFITAKIYLPPLTTPERIASIKILHDGRCAISYKLRTKSIQASCNAVGIDLGINQIAAVAFSTGESILYPGGILLAKQHYFLKKIAACKPSGYNENNTSKKSSLKKDAYYLKWRRQKRIILDNITTSIINECLKRKIGTIVLGDIKGIRTNKDFGKVMNQKLHAWPFLDIQTMLKYKAEKWSIEVQEVSEKYTSRTCCLCGCINPSTARIERGLLACTNCGLAIHADVNGAFNILLKYLPPENRVGVLACLRGQPSHEINHGSGKLLSQIIPTFSARLDLRTYRVALMPCRSANR